MRELGRLPRNVEDTGEGVVIDVRDLRMRYGSVDVLRGVEFIARRGEVLALLGPNGAGKTTTIEIRGGFRMRSAGEVGVLGVDPAKGDEAWRARVGVVLQSWRDHGRWRVRELLDNLGRYYSPYSTPERRLRDRLAPTRPESRRQRVSRPAATRATRRLPTPASPPQRLPIRAWVVPGAR